MTYKISDRKKKESRSEILGMSFDSANYELRRKNIFSLMKKCELDICYRCNEKITEEKEMSIEHKIPWQDKENAIEIFFDVENNIAFSHKFCNSIHTSRSLEAKHNSSGYRGVSYRKNDSRNKPYVARIRHKGKTIQLGYYETPKEAALAYDEAAAKYQGSRALTNKKMGLL